MPDSAHHSEVEIRNISQAMTPRSRITPAPYAWTHQCGPTVCEPDPPAHANQLPLARP